MLHLSFWAQSKRASNTKDRRYSDGLLRYSFHTTLGGQLIALQLRMNGQLPLVSEIYYKVCVSMTARDGTFRGCEVSTLDQAF